MKVTVDIDCTPAEARHFFGLPDLQPMQEAVMQEMQRRVLAEMDRFAPEALLKNWMSLVPQGPEQMRDAFSQIFKASTKSGKSTPK
jgi:hypothetical protein